MNSGHNINNLILKKYQKLKRNFSGITNVLRAQHEFDARRKASLPYSSAWKVARHNIIHCFSETSLRVHCEWRHAGKETDCFFRTHHFRRYYEMFHRQHVYPTETKNAESFTSSYIKPLLNGWTSEWSYKVGHYCGVHPMEKVPQFILRQINVWNSFMPCELAAFWDAW